LIGPGQRRRRPLEPFRRCPEAEHDRPWRSLLAGCAAPSDPSCSPGL